MGWARKRIIRTRRQRINELLEEGKAVPWREVYVAQGKGNVKRRKGKNNKQPTGRVVTPKLLGGEEVLAEQYSDPRKR